MKTLVLKVENIKCGGCINTIIKSIQKKDSQASIIVNEDKETIIINSIYDKDVFLEILLGLGYPEKGSNSFFKKSKSYISCAIGKMN